MSQPNKPSPPVWDDEEWWSSSDARTMHIESMGYDSGHRSALRHLLTHVLNLAEEQMIRSSRTARRPVATDDAHELAEADRALWSGLLNLLKPKKSP